MKITHLIAAATMIAGLGVATAADAQGYRDYRHDRHERRYDRGYHGYHGYDRGRGYGERSRCHTEYRHHRRVTVCYR